jgi:two-component system, NtrC family, response regulator AtoC
MADTTHQLSPTSEAPTPEGRYVSLVFSYGQQAQAVALRDREPLVVGRAPPATCVIEDVSLSRLHAQFFLQDGVVQVRDERSTNGVWLRGVRVARALLAEGDVLRLGSVEVRVGGGLDAPRDARLLGHSAFRARVDHELARARAFGRGAVLAAVGDERGDAKALLSTLREVDAVLVDERAPLVLLAEADAGFARSWVDGVRRRLGEATRVGLALMPSHGGSFDELVEHATRAMRGAAPKRGPVTLQVAPTTGEEGSAPLVLADNMRRLYELAARAARTTLPVLVLGETGAGKELVARTIHERSARSDKPFKPLNCATIPANLIESVLFGHERGAFTGADKQSLGLFEQAHGGTVFLDEVGELSAPAQAALLRVLELKRIVRVGGSRELDVDVRVVAATHRDLAAMARAGQFREDLMFRLDALTLQVPPLRERRAEIRPLADAFLARARHAFAVSACGFGDDVYEALESYDWPGNVRQLKNAVERAAAVCAGDTIELEDLPAQIADAPLRDSVPPVVATPQGFRPLPERVREFEMAIIREAMDKAHGNQAQAARMLGVPRRTLANKVHAYGMVEGGE